MPDKRNSMEIVKTLNRLNTEIKPETDSDVAIILAAGHGKRIRSRKSKMLHRIWGIPSVVRVCRAVDAGLKNAQQIIVVGIKALEVAKTVGKSKGRMFIYQEEQKGTGHAVMAGLNPLENLDFKGFVYVFPGDMGLLNGDVVRKFREDFLQSDADMMVLTGVYEGDVSQNSYGRIIRVPERDAYGHSSGEAYGRVVEIKERKDIDALKETEKYKVHFVGKDYLFSRDQLLNISEFNTGVFAFKYESLRQFISEIKPDNIQKEYYITDMISIFNRHDLTVRATKASDNATVVGFNVKSVLKEMENIARHNVWLKLKDIITIEDPEDFFIAENVAEKLLMMDKEQGPLDIIIGKGAHIDAGVQLNRGVEIGMNAYLEGNISLGENVKIHENVFMSTYPHQKMVIGRNSEILQGDIIKGNLQIGENSRIESSVNMTGSDEFPMIVGDNVTIKGTSYLFGSIVDDDLLIEHSVLKNKHAQRIVRKDGSIQPIQWVMPMPRGLDSISELPEKDNQTPEQR